MGWDEVRCGVKIRFQKKGKWVGTVREGGEVRGSKLEVPSWGVMGSKCVVEKFRGVRDKHFASEKVR